MQDRIIYTKQRLINGEFTACYVSWKKQGKGTTFYSSPVCRINEKLANTQFASSFFAQKTVLPLILTLIDAYAAAKPIPALFARRRQLLFVSIVIYLRSICIFAAALRTQRIPPCPQSPAPQKALPHPSLLNFRTACSAVYRFCPA